MGTQQHLQLPNAEGRKRPPWMRLLFLIIVIGAITIAVVWILSGLSLIPSIWASVLSAIVTVLGVVIGLWPLVFNSQKSESSHSSSNIQEVTSTRHSEIAESEQNIEGRDGTNRQTISANNNGNISRSKQNIKLT